MPLAVHCGGVASVGEEFGDGIFPRRKPRQPLSGIRDPEGSRAHRMPPRKDSRACRRALDLDVVVVKADALAGKLVDTRRGYHSAVRPESSPADVVQKDED